MFISSAMLVVGASVYLLVKFVTLGSGTTGNVAVLQGSILHFACVCWVGYLLLLLPTMGLVDEHVNAMAADRYSYIPSLLLGVPFTAVGSSLVSAHVAKISEHSVMPVFVLVVAGLIFLTQPQVRIWNSSVTLWAHNIKDISPNDGVSLINLGIALKDEKRPQEAVPYLEKAIVRIVWLFMLL
jgi:hypothetical protein